MKCCQRVFITILLLSPLHLFAESFYIANALDENLYLGTDARGNIILVDKDHATIWDINTFFHTKIIDHSRPDFGITFRNQSEETDDQLAISRNGNLTDWNILPSTANPLYVRIANAANPHYLTAPYQEFGSGKQVIQGFRDSQGSKWLLVAAAPLGEFGTYSTTSYIAKIRIGERCLQSASDTITVTACVDADSQKFRVTSRTAVNGQPIISIGTFLEDRLITKEGGGSRNVLLGKNGEFRLNTALREWPVAGRDNIFELSFADDLFLSMPHIPNGPLRASSQKQTRFQVEIIEDFRPMHWVLKSHARMNFYKAVGHIRQMKNFNVVVFGDSGKDGPSEQTAQNMTAVSTHKPFNFGIIVGDNHYEYGVEQGVRDEKWIRNFENPYGRRLNIPFFSVIGNHDTMLFPESQIEYSGSKATNWIMPKFSYSFQVGDILFVAVNSNDMLSPDRYNGNPYMGPEQFSWLEALLKTTSAKRKVVFMHHPFFSNGVHWKDRWNKAGVAKEAILSLFNETKVDLVLSGHEHSSLMFDGSVHLLAPKFVISGNAAKNDTKRMQQDSSTLFDLELHKKSHPSTGSFGFVLLEVHNSNMVVSFYDEKSTTPLYSYELPALSPTPH